MNKRQATKMVIQHFKNADKYNQLRPGETTLAIRCFVAGFQAMLGLTDSVKLDQESFENVVEDVEEYFDQFVDSETQTKEVV